MSNEILYPYGKIAIPGQEQTIACKLVEPSFITICLKNAEAEIKCIQQMLRLKNINIKYCAG